MCLVRAPEREKNKEKCVTKIIQKVSTIASLQVNGNPVLFRHGQTFAPLR
jgi:hypothetical protein